MKIYGLVAYFVRGQLDREARLSGNPQTLFLGEKCDGVYVFHERNYYSVGFKGTEIGALISNGKENPQKKHEYCFVPDRELRKLGDEDISKIAVYFDNLERCKRMTPLPIKGDISLELR